MVAIAVILCVTITDVNDNNRNQQFCYDRNLADYLDYIEITIFF